MNFKRILSAFLAICVMSIMTVFAASSTQEAAIEEAVKSGITVGNNITDISTSSYIASNGEVVTVEFAENTESSIKNATLLEEKESYSGTDFISTDGIVTTPKWFEGTKKIRAAAVLKCGNVELESDVYYNLLPEAAPTINVSGSYVDIGNRSSERRQSFDGVRMSAIKTRVVDNVEQTYRTLYKNGAMVINTHCEGTKVNYLTVKLWGGDVGDTMLWIADPKTGNMNFENTRQPYRNGLVDRKEWVELNASNSTTPQFDGGFIYVTYEIPEVYTEGRATVSLRLYSTGGPANYANVNIKEQKEESRGIYAVWMTQDAQFDPELYDDKLAGGYVQDTVNPYSVLNEEDMSQKKAEMTDIIKSGIESFKSFQIYGADNYPSYMDGMMTRSTNWKKKKSTDSDWKTAYYNSNYMLKQNLTPLNAFSVFAYAYNNADKLGYSNSEKQEFLDRIISGVDFLCRAQGSNGGFHKTTWIGGPQRAEAGGNNLTGFGLRYVGEGIIEVMESLSSSVLSQKIDSDADGKADTVRKTAWINMMSSAREYLTSLDGAGHAPNQDMADIIAALRFDKAEKLLGGDGMSKDEAKFLLDIAFGKEKNISCSSYWVSPKGTILENFGSIQGGYSGDYGSAAILEAAELAEISKYYGLDYDEDILNMYHIIDTYYFTGKAVDKDGNFVPVQYTEGVVSNRNAYYPGTERYVIDVYSALKLRNKTALKVMVNYLEHKHLSQMEELTPSNVHFEDNIIDIIHLYDNFDEIIKAAKEEEISDYNYLMENDDIETFAYADEMARNVVIKNGDEKIYLALNWRNPMHSQNYYNNSSGTDRQRIKASNLARVHNVTPEYDRYGYAAVDTHTSNVPVYDSAGNTIGSVQRYIDTWTEINGGRITSRYSENGYMQALMEMQYGEYTILMNSTNCGPTGNDYNKSYLCAELNLSNYGIEAGKRYVDLITFTEYTCVEENGFNILYDDNGDKFVLECASTAVLAEDSGYTKAESSENFEAEYYGGKIKISNYPDSGTVTGDNEYTVFAAEYNKDGTLKDVVLGNLKTEYARNDYIVTMDAVPARDANIYIWDKNMSPKTKQ